MSFFHPYYVKQTSPELRDLSMKLQIVAEIKGLGAEALDYIDEYASSNVCASVARRHRRRLQQLKKLKPLLDAGREVKRLAAEFSRAVRKLEAIADEAFKEVEKMKE